MRGVHNGAWQTVCDRYITSLDTVAGAGLKVGGIVVCGSGDTEQRWVSCETD